MRVLVVDDEVRLADGVRRGLEAEGWAVDVAHDGVDGLWHAGEFAYDAVVLDLMMPGMSGWAVCGALRSAGRALDCIDPRSAAFALCGRANSGRSTSTPGGTGPEQPSFRTRRAPWSV